MIEDAKDLAAHVGVVVACEALGIPRSSFYRAQQEVKPEAQSARPAPARALSEAEQELVREVLNSPRFQDQAPGKSTRTCSTKASTIVRPQDTVCGGPCTAS